MFLNSLSTIEMPYRRNRQVWAEDCSTPILRCSIKNIFCQFHIRMFSKLLHLLIEITFNIYLLFRRAHPYIHSRLNLTFPIMARYQDQFASNRMMDSDLRVQIYCNFIFKPILYIYKFLSNTYYIIMDVFKALFYI